MSRPQWRPLAEIVDGIEHACYSDASVQRRSVVPINRLNILSQPSQGTVYEHLADVTHSNIHTARIGVAYATVAGMRMFLGAFPDHQDVTFQWVIGLDDHITHPDAVKVAMALPRSKVRLVRSTPGRTFHPKFISLKSRGKSQFAIIGSANLTRSGLLTNSEVVVSLRTTDTKKKRTLNNAWAPLWASGETATEKLLDSYVQEFRANRTATTPPPEPHDEILESDAVTIDPQ
ncbi:MAG: NgoFVII family restriction endonuclease, partial [Gammaproteobacteria bacterium]|nr:NgoFVII family restriction endonuclease [Gammaproteobacteria bacterium]